MAAQHQLRLIRPSCPWPGIDAAPRSAYCGEGVISEDRVSADLTAPPVNLDAPLPLGNPGAPWPLQQVGGPRCLYRAGDIVVSGGGLGGGMLPAAAVLNVLASWRSVWLLALVRPAGICLPGARRLVRSTADHTTFRRRFARTRRVNSRPRH